MSERYISSASKGTDPIPSGIDPAILKLAREPLDGMLPSVERAETFDEARKLAALDKARNRKVTVKDGEHYWAAEYPNIFTFDGQLRGKFDWVHRDSSERSAEQQMATIGGLEGQLTDVIIETDDGEMVIIRKRNDAISAQKQEFDLVSTRMARKAAESGADVQPKTISTEALAGVVLVPGLPMNLSKDPNTGMHVKTQGNIVRITGLRLNEDGKVAEGHPYLSKPEKATDAREKFNGAMRAARSGIMASAAIRRS